MMVSNKTKKQLRSLQQEAKSIKDEIGECTILLDRMILAKKLAPILEKIHDIELQIEKERVATAVKEWEDLYPPLTEKCPVCHELIRLGTNIPLGTFPCCSNSICKSCGDKRRELGNKVFTDESEFKAANACPVCGTHVPPLGGDEFRTMIRQNANEGKAEAQNNLGGNLIYGRNGFEQNEEEGWKWVQKAADQNHPKALIFLGGEGYLDGSIVPSGQSYSKALPLLEKAAKLGAFEAHDRLGQMYLIGEGVQKDKAEAMKHFTISYGLGSHAAPYRLGGMFLLSNDKSPFIAKHYLEEACLEHDIEQAYGLLGDAIMKLALDSYGTSIHIPGHSPMPKANYWLRKAAANGDKQALEKSNDLVQANQQLCYGCLRTAIDAPRAPGIEQCTTPLMKCQRCKTLFYCSRECQAAHWKRGHKVDCIPKSYLEAEDNGCTQS